VFAQAIETMSRAPPPSLAMNQFEQSPPFANISLQSLSQQFPPSLSILQQAIQQSDQQLNSNPAAYSISNGFNSVAPFQPFDLFPNTYPGIPVGPVPTPVPPQQQQQSPMQANNIRLGSPQTMSSPMNISHTSPPSQVQQAQPNNSPRMSGGSTLQFVPSQVLRKMPKSHK
jgi:hypothetical protein